MEIKKQRNSSIELLRIIAMLFIVLSHLCVHNGIAMSEMPISVNKIFVQWGTLGNLGVDIFVIISGYFISTKDFSRKRLIDLLTQVWFYSILLAVVCIFAFHVTVGTKDIIKVVLPTIFAEYWFFTAYIVLLLISPFINILIKNLERASFAKLLFILVGLWVVIPTFTKQSMYGGELAQFVLLYLIGAYFRKYPDNCFSKRKVRSWCTALCWALLLLSVICVDLLSSKLGGALNAYRGYFFSRHSLLIVGIAVGMFAIAVYRKPFTSKLINTVSSCVFGVYLIHDNPLVRKIIWTRIFPISQIYDSSLFILYAAGIVITVFLVCAAVEFVRSKTVAMPISNAVDRVVRWAERKLLKGK